MGARRIKSCQTLGISYRTLLRWKNESGLQDKRKLIQQKFVSNKLTPEQRKMVLDTVNHKNYVDLPPCKIVPLLADQGRYIASESTFYRILREENLLGHRRLSRPNRHQKPSSYIAYKSCQIWSWDITYLPSRVSGIYFYLYMIMDVFSRKIVGFTVEHRES